MVSILRALRSAKPGTSVVLQRSTKAVYAIDQELPIPRGVRLTGSGAPGTPTGPTPTLQQVAGASLQCIAASGNYLAGLYGPSHPGAYPQFNALYGNGIPTNRVWDAIEVDHITFDGQNGGTGSGNTHGHGLVMFTFEGKVHDCTFVDIANTAIFVADINYVGAGGSNRECENRVIDNTILNPGWYGIFVGNDPDGFGGSTDGHILNNVVWSPSQQQRAAGPLVNPGTGSYYEALHMSNAAGWWVANNLFGACPGNGAYFNTTGGLHLVGNTLDGFGCCPKARHAYVGFNITTAGQTKLHPGRIIGNLAVAYESTNPFAPDVPATSTNTYSYYKVTMETDPGRQPQPSYDAFVTEADNIAHQGSQFPPPIAGATVTTNTVEVPHGAAAAVVAGMEITDALHLIPSGTKVTAVVPGSGSNPDTIELSATAHPGSGDTVSFSGPTSIGFTYENAFPITVGSGNLGVAMTIYRSNQITTGTVDGTPVTTIRSTPGFAAPTITLLDSERFAGGEFVAAPPAEAGDIIVASSPPSPTVVGTAVWQQALATGAIDGPVGGALSGTLPDPGFSPDVVTLMTESGSYAPPVWATTLRVTCIGGGGGGGGGGLAPEGGQAGGAGGAAGTTAEQVVPIAGSTAVAVSVGNGGAGGGGAAAGRPAGDGGAGGSTVVTVGGATVLASGGPGGPGASSGTNGVDGAAHGAPPGTTVSTPLAASGGPSGSAGGNPFAFSPGGGGGGGRAGAVRGGSGGGAGDATAGGPGGVTGASPTPAGSDGLTATAAGAGGGGGGGGLGGAGGDGGDGAPGFVILEVVR